MEFLIRIVDKCIGEDCSKSGDVIAACADGWAWSSEELNNHDWRIIRVPGIIQSTVDALLAKSQLDTVKRRREYFINTAKLPDPTLFAGARTQAIIALTKQQVLAAATKKP